MSFQELAAIKSPLLRGLVLNPPERRSEEEMNAFFSENQPDLERKIGAALDDVIGMKYSGALGDMATCAAEYTVDSVGVQYEQQQYDQYYPEQYYAASSMTHVVDGSYVDEADPDSEELEQRRLGA